MASAGAVSDEALRVLADGLFRELDREEAGMPKPKRVHDDPGSVDARFPHLAAWVQDGWVEIGRDDYSRSVVRALASGGMVFEGKVQYASLDDALRDLDAGIAEWLAENA